MTVENEKKEKEWKYLVMSYGYFGIGCCIWSAEKNWKKAGGRRDTKIIVWRFPRESDVQVHGGGGVSWTWIDGYEKSEHNQQMTLKEAKAMWEKDMDEKFVDLP